MFEREPSSGSPDPRERLVGDQQRASIGAEPAQRVRPARRDRDDPARAENELDDHGGRLTGGRTVDRLDRLVEARERALAAAPEAAAIGIGRGDEDRPDGHRPVSASRLPRRARQSERSEGPGRDSRARAPPPRSGRSSASPAEARARSPRTRCCPKKHVSSGSGLRAASRSASRIRTEVVNRLPICMSCAACLPTASTTCGWPWPVAMQNWPDSKSRKCRPSTSQKGAALAALEHERRRVRRLPYQRLVECEPGRRVALRRAPAVRTRSLRGGHAEARVCVPGPSAPSSSLRELMLSLVRILRMCHSIVRVLRKSCAAISGFV